VREEDVGSLLDGSEADTKSTKHGWKCANSVVGEDAPAFRLACSVFDTNRFKVQRGVGVERKTAPTVLEAAIHHAPLHAGEAAGADSRPSQGSNYHRQREQGELVQEHGGTGRAAEKTAT